MSREPRPKQQGLAGWRERKGVWPLKASATPLTPVSSPYGRTEATAVRRKSISRKSVAYKPIVRALPWPDDKSRAYQVKETKSTDKDH